MGIRLMIETALAIGRGLKEIVRLATSPIPVAQEVNAWNHDESHKELDAIYNKYFGRTR